MHFSEPESAKTRNAAALRRLRRAGFTLLEIIVAVTIFSILTVAVYSTFRIGLRSYKAGREQMVINQTGRVAFDLFARDLRSLYYLGPPKYNQNLIRQLQFQLMQQMQNEPGGRRGVDLGRRLGFGTGRRGRSAGGGEADEENKLVGIPIDLTIIGTDHNDTDSITFVTYQFGWGEATVEPWALARVKYFVEDGNLYRVEGPVWVDKVPSFQWKPPEDRDAEGDEESKEEDQAAEPSDADGYLKDAPRELVARNVKVFDLHYGYWTEDGWFEAPDWKAHERRYRNAPHKERRDTLDSGALRPPRPTPPPPTDDVPAYVSVTLALGYGEKAKRTRVFRSKIRLMSSLETYKPYIDPSLDLGIGAPTSGRRSTPFRARVGRRPPFMR